MKNYIIKEINKDDAKYLVFGTSVESPLYNLEEIKKEIQCLNGERIIIDQLLQTGNGENRFIVLSYSNGDFDLNSIHISSNKNTCSCIKSFGCDFLRNHLSILEYSILLSEQKEAIINGYNI